MKKLMIKKLLVFILLLNPQPIFAPPAPPPLRAAPPPAPPKTISPKEFALYTTAGALIETLAIMSYNKWQLAYAKKMYAQINLAIQNYISNFPVAGNLVYANEKPIENWIIIEYIIRNRYEDTLKTFFSLHGSEPENCPLFIYEENFFVYVTTPIIYAAQTNFDGGVQYLAELGANINEKTKLLFIPKITDNIYSLVGLAALHFAVKNANLNIVKILVDNGADINIKSDTNPQKTIGELTPLHFACINSEKPGMFEIVKYLVEHGADINAKNVVGKTPYNLLLNSKKSENKIKIINYLVSKGAKK